MYNERAREVIRNEILNAMENTLSKNEGSYNFDIAGATAVGINTTEKEVAWLYKQMFPWTVDDDYFLDLHLQIWNLTRKAPTYAKGVVTFSGDPNIEVPRDTIVVSRLGQEYRTLSSEITDEFGITNANVEAVTPGEIGNAPIGDLTTLQISITGINTVTNADRISGGFEIESVQSARDRMAEKARLPAHSGNVNDYIIWTKSVAGVGAVRVVSAGELTVQPGFVEIYITDFRNAPADTQLVAEVQSYLNTMRPVPSTVTVFSKVSLNVNITIDTLYARAGLYTKAQMEQKISDSIKGAIANIQFVKNDTISIPRTINIILDTDGVIDLDNLLINGNNANIVVPLNAVPVLTGVSITNYVEQ